MPASVRVRVTHLLLRVLSRARECSLARSAFWHASVSRVSRERLARFVTFLVSGTVWGNPYVKYPIANTYELDPTADGHSYQSSVTLWHTGTCTKQPTAK